MANALKPFKQFILDASNESELPIGQQKKLIRGFYEIVSKPDYDNDQVEDYLKNQGYKVDEEGEDLRRIANLHNSTKWFWGLHTVDY